MGQSQTVEKFAREWRQMLLTQKKATPLVAPWNAQDQGSYFTAFHPLKYDPNVTLGASVIYEGTAWHVIGYSDGYEIELNEYPAGGRPLYIWIPETCLSIGGAGKHMKLQLFKLSQAPASPASVYIYALGQFNEWPAHMPNRLVLEVEHPHMCWIVS